MVQVEVAWHTASDLDESVVARLPHGLYVELQGTERAFKLYLPPSAALHRQLLLTNSVISVFEVQVACPRHTIIGTLL